MAKNSILFPDTFADSLSRLPVGRFGDESATTAWVKQLIAEMFYGRGVPLFFFNGASVSWNDGISYFDGIAHPVGMGTYLFESLDTGWYYIYAQQEEDKAHITVSGSPPTLAAQQLWWHLRVESGLIVDVIPVKAGFGV